MSFNYSPRIVTNGLVFYVDAANPTSYISGSTAWNDLTRNNINFTATATSVFDSSNVGSIVFDGVARSFTNQGNTYSANSGVTISTWVKISGSGGVIFSHDSGTNNGFRYGTSGNQLVFTLGSVADYLTGHIINSGVWKNIVASVFGNTANIYVDGVFIIGFTIGTMAGTPNAFRIAYSALTPNPFYLPGNISSVMFYNRPLNASEVVQNYNAIKSRFGK